MASQEPMSIAAAADIVGGGQELSAAFAVSAAQKAFEEAQKAFQEVRSVNNLIAIVEV